MANEVKVEISLEERAALKALTALTKNIDKFEKEAVKSVKNTDKAFDSFKGNLSAIAASGAIKAIGSGLKELALGSLEAAASTEKIQTQLEVLTGSQEKAAALYKELTAFSASTPFQLQGIAEASAQLISFGFEADTVQGRIAKIGEVAAGSGSDLKEVALIYGQVAAAGKLTGERLLQFQERAIPIGAALAKSLGVAESEVKDLVSSGVVGFNEFEKAFNSLSESGGLFEGAIDKQSQTINGVLSTLSDNFFILQSEIGKAFAPSLIEGAKSLTTALQSLNEQVKDDSKGFGLYASIISETIGNVSGFAGELVRVKAPMEDINDQLADLLSREQELRKEAKESTDTMGEYFGLFDANKRIGIEQTAKELSKVEEQIKKLEVSRQNLIKAERVEAKKGKEDTSEDTSEDARVQKEAQVSAQVLEERKKFQVQSDLLKQEQKIKEQESILANKELETEQRALSLEALREFENSKVEIQLTSELEKNKKIRDSGAKELADEAARLKASIAIQQNNAKAEQAINDARVKNREQMVAGFGVALGMASQLARKGTAEQKALAIASTAINTYRAGARAMADYPYPANIAVLAATVGVGLKQVDNIRKQSFATGGVVGGFSGATMGGDNTTANVRTGEMVLNAQQQRQLFDTANNRNSNAGESQNIEVTSVVQIDGREIARTVRDQRKDGFKI